MTGQITRLNRIAVSFITVAPSPRGGWSVVMVEQRRGRSFRRHLAKAPDKEHAVYVATAVAGMCGRPFCEGEAP